MGRNRIVWIDNLRGFLIILVVLGHAIQYTHPAYGSTLVFRYIYSFHMPLFMFVSGLVCGMLTSGGGGISVVEKRFVQLIVPFLIYNVVFALLVGDLRLVWYYCVNPEKRLWFLWVLFFVTVVQQSGFWIAKMIRIKEWIVQVILGVALFVLSHWITVFSVPDIAKYFVFYCVAFYLAPYIMKIKYNKHNLATAICLTMTFAVLAYWCFYPYPEMIPFTNIKLPGVAIKPYKMLVAFWGIATFVLIFRLFADKTAKLFTTVGARDTLGIYAIHMVLLHLIPFKKVLTPLMDQGYVGFYWLGIIMLIVVLLVASIGFIWLFRTNKVSSLLFLGENHFKTK